MKQKGNFKMTYTEFIEWVHNLVLHIKDAALGSFVYFLYGHFYQKKKIKQGLVSFFTGTVFAIYLAPAIQPIVPFQIQATSFMVGLLGMRLTEALINQDYKKFISGKLGMKEEKSNTEQEEGVEKLNKNN